MKQFTESLLNEEPQVGGEDYYVVAGAYGTHFVCLLLVSLTFSSEFLIQSSEREASQILLLVQQRMNMFFIPLLGLIIGYPYIFLQTLLMKLCSKIMNAIQG